MSTVEPTPVPADAAAARPSRQALVVPPRQSSLPMVVGGCLCAAAGFGIVWTVGLGRGSHTVHEAAPDTVQADDRPAGDGASLPADDTTAGIGAPEPDMLPPSDDALPMEGPSPAPRWGGRPSSDATAETVGDRYAVRSASLDVPAGFAAPATGTTLPDAAAAAGSPPQHGDDAVVPAGGGMAPEPVDPDAMPEPPATGDQPDLDEPPATLAPPQHDAGRDPEPSIQPPTAAFGAAPPPFASADPPPRAAAPPAFIPPPPVAAAPFQEAVLPATSAEPPTGPPVTGSPFAAAPPMAFAPAARGGVPAAEPPPFPEAAPPSRPASGEGQGRPGPMQLEGIQTPQVSVEKRGPREVSVGKPARYEIVVRNVGSVTAHEVMLRDTVPRGTALVATTPPASPVPASPDTEDGALAWSLGALPAGGQAVVTMEVMPQTEGEIGSVASVTFRADASIRSRATKPDLAIECQPPEPVLIGRDLQVTITVTNPGTGVATGVVLEGFLPENVSHRSGRELEFDVGQLRPGESRTIDLVLGTRGPGVHAARLVARADGGVEIVRQLPIEVTAPTLEIAIDMPVRRFLQRPATCTIAMTNAGTAPARAVELAAQLPPGMKFVRANNAGWHDDRTHRVLWSLEELPPGETGTVQVVVMPVELGPQRITAAARSGDGLSAQVAHACDVEGLAAVSFEVVDSEDPIEVGGVTEYVVRVVNQGTKPASGVRLAAALLGDLEPVEAEGPGGHRFDNATIAFEPLAKLAPAEEAVFRIRAKGRGAGDQRIQVQLTSADQAAPITKEETTRVYADR